MAVTWTAAIFPWPETGGASWKASTASGRQHILAIRDGRCDREERSSSSAPSCVAHSLTLGTCPPALDVFEQRPDLFATVRGGLGSLYFPLLIVAWLGYVPLLIRKGVAEDGTVPCSWLVGAGVTVAGAIIAGAAGWLDGSTAGAVGFLLPGLLGLGVWRTGRRLASTAS